MDDLAAPIHKLLAASWIAALTGQQRVGLVVIYDDLPRCLDLGRVIKQVKPDR